jgi:multiple sugar transport system substrate-binding protein
MGRRQFLRGALVVGAAAAVPGVAACQTEEGKARTNPTPATAAGVPQELIDEAAQFKGTTANTLSQKQYLETANGAIDRAVKQFASQTGTTINNVTVNTDEGNFIAKQDAAVKAGDVQDMAFVAASRFVAQLHELGDIEDVTAEVDQLQQKYGAVGAAAEANLKIDGKWWGIPYYTIGGGGWWLRKDWLEAKGITREELTSFEDLRDAMLEISDPAQKRYGWGVTVNRSNDGNVFIESVINHWGGSFTADDGRKVVFNSPETVAAVQFLADIYRDPKYKNMLPPGVMSWTDTGNNEAWLAGILGATLNSASIYAQSKSTGNPVYANTWAFEGFTGPATDKPLNAINIDTMAFVIFKGGKNAGLAKVLAKYLAAGEAFLGLAKEAGALVYPAYEGIWDTDPFYRTGDPYFPVAHSLVTADLPFVTKTGYHFPQPASSGRNAALSAYILTDMMGEIIQKGTAVPTAVATAHQRIVQAFTQLGIKQ